MYLQSTIQIAVLPFANLSPDKDSDYICDGLSEAIINKLATIEGLSVTSRTSSFKFKNSDLGLPEIAQTLGVDSLIEGTVRFIAQQLKVSLNLVSTSKDAILWSNAWVYNLEDIFSLEVEISAQLAEKLRELFWHFDFDGIKSVQPEIEIKDYKIFLKANQLQFNWNQEDAFQAITMYNRVIERAPNFADAYIYKIACYSFLRGQGFVSSEEITEEINDTIQVAIRLGPQSPDLHSVLAGFHFWNNWNLKASFEEIQKALHINPSHAESHNLLGLIYAMSDKKQLAKKHFIHALKLDPLSANKYLTKAWGVYMLMEYEEAASLCKKALALNSYLLVAVHVYIYALLSQEKGTEAFKLLSSFKGKLDTPSYEGLKGLCMACTGNELEVEQCISKLLVFSQGEGRERAIEFLILIYGYTNDANNAIKWMKIAHEIQLPILLGLTKTPLIHKVALNHEFIEIEKSFTVLNWSDEYKPNKKAEPDSAWIKVQKEKLVSFMEKEKPFLQASITLRELASALEVQPNGLSWLINNQFGRNFSDYINMHRVEAFKEMVIDSKNAHLSLLGIAFECGFNSKTSFNTIFKKETGVTPKQYLKQNS